MLLIKQKLIQLQQKKLVINKFPFKNIEYLKEGTDKQKAAYSVLCRSNVLDNLKEFDPILAGTIPLDIDIEGSDLDIICYSTNFKAFEHKICEHYKNNLGFNSYYTSIKGEESFIVKFSIDDFDFEIFCQNTPTLKQYAVIHLIIEKRLLNLFGKEAKKSIRELKRQGMKTEPAFAKYFNLAGDPYDSLVNLAKLSDKDLFKLLSKKLTKQRG